MSFSLSRTLGLGNSGISRPLDRVTNTIVDPLNITGIKDKTPETFDASASGQRRDAAYNTGIERGKKEFYDDPDMQMLRKRREDLSQGYNGQELGALRQEARGNLAGQNSNYLRQLQGQQARAGVGGARGAAMQNAARQGFAGQAAEAERKLALDSGQMKRQGVNDLQDYITRQKLGKLGLAYGEQALSSADYAAERGVQAAQSGGKK
jgi:hypothetical protein